MKFNYKKTIFYLVVFLICFLFLLFIIKLSMTKKIIIDTIPILYQDDYVIIIDKPEELASHKTKNWYGQNVVELLKQNGYKLDDNNEDPEQDGIVSRLDVGTSGVMALAKNDYSHEILKDQYMYRTVKKVYHLLVEGIVKPSIGTIYAPIKKNGDDDDYEYSIDKDGKQAITNYKVLEVFPSTHSMPPLSLVEATIETGRTHQIRLHFSHINNPLVGDLRYGADPNISAKLNIQRQWLHSKYLEFNHPLNGKRFVMITEYPDDLKKSLEIINSQYHN